MPVEAIQDLGFKLIAPDVEPIVIGALVSSIGAAEAIGIRFECELRLAHHAIPGRRWSAVAGNAEDVAIFQTPGNGRCRIAGIQPDRANLKVKAPALPIQTVEIDATVMHIGRRDVDIGDDGQLSIHRAVVEIVEALRLAVAHHIAAFRIGAADLGCLRLLLPLLVRHRFLAVQCPFHINGPIKISPTVGPGSGDHLKVVFALVGIGLQMRAAGIKHCPIDQSVPDRLFDDVVENILGDRSVVKAPPPVLAQCEASNTASLNFRRRNQR